MNLYIKRKWRYLLKMYNEKNKHDKVYAFIKNGNVYGYSFHHDFKNQKDYEITIMSKKKADKLFEEFFFRMEK